jgi:ketosteroid isomerase-like protein
VVGAAWHWHIEAAKRKDLEAVIEIYAPDVVYSVPGQPDVRGIDAVREMEAQTLASADVVAAEHRTVSLHAFGDAAYEIGTVVGPIRSGAEPPRVVRYTFMAMWVRDESGGWRIRHIVGQVLPPDAPG